MTLPCRKQCRSAILGAMIGAGASVACAETPLASSPGESLPLLVLSALAGGSIPAATGALLGAIWGRRLNRLSASLFFPLAGSLLAYGIAVSVLLLWLKLHEAWPGELFDPRNPGKAALILAGIPILLSMAYGIPTGLIVRTHGSRGIAPLTAGLILWMGGAWIQPLRGGGDALLFLFFGCALALLPLWTCAALVMLERFRNLTAAGTPDGSTA